METTSLQKDYIVAAIPVFLVLLLMEMMASHLTGRKLYKTHDTISSLTAGSFQTLLGVFVSPILAQPYIFLYDRFRVMDVDPGSTWAWWAAFIGIDIGYYWFHRAGHRVNLFWATHAPHHSSECYNLSTALRQGAVQPFVSFLFYLPLALFIPPSLAMFHSQWNTIYQFWIHTQFIKTLGPIDYILNTPSHHSVHHGRNPAYIDKNYAGTLIIWDMLFGTFEWESEKAAYGLVHPLSSWDPLFTQYHHFVDIWKRVQSAETFHEKFGAVFYGPGWTPAGELPVPPVEKNVVIWDTPQPLIVDAYVVVHFLAVLAGSFLFLSNQQLFSATMSVAIATYIVFSLTSFGFLCEGRRFAVHLERLRLLLTVCLSWLVPHNTCPTMVATGVGISFFWLFLMPRKHPSAEAKAKVE